MEVSTQSVAVKGGLPTDRGKGRLRWSGMPDERRSTEPREGISVSTLVIAATASAVTAVLVRELWGPGAIIGAALTPVLITVIQETLKRPAEQVSRVTPRPLRRPGRPLEPDEPDIVQDPVMPPEDPLPSGEFGERQVYGMARRRRHWRLAVITGAIAFLIAGTVLTFSELVLGGEVAGKQRTTFFGGRDEPSTTPDEKATPEPTTSPDAEDEEATPEPTTSPTVSPDPTTSPTVSPSPPAESTAAPAVPTPQATPAPPG